MELFASWSDREIAIHLKTKVWSSSSKVLEREKWAEGLKSDFLYPSIKYSRQRTEKDGLHKAKHGSKNLGTLNIK